MKKFFVLLISILMTIKLVPLQTHVVSKEFRVYIHGEKQNYDQPPVLENSRTLVPLRGIFETLEATSISSQTFTHISQKSKSYSSNIL